LRVLTTTVSIATLALVCAIGTTTSLTVTPPGPPTDTDHGVNESTFHTLWSGDTDDGEIPNESTAMQELAGYIDIPYDAPPAAVDQWNAGDHQDFPKTNAETSTHPANVSLTHGAYVKDAYVETFAVSPSTRVHLGPSDTPLYVAPNGTVYATLDYRVQAPSETRTNDTRTSWRVLDTETTETRLLVDGNHESTTEKTHTPVLAYTDLNEEVGTTHQFTVAANVTTTLERTVETRTLHCENGTDTSGNNSTTCTDVWIPNTTTDVENVTVTDTVDVVAYEFLASVRAVEYPDGDLGLAVRVLQPWQGFELDDASVNGSWEFYSARDPAWDTLTRRTHGDQRPVDSPSQPLQVHAYPMPQRSGASATSDAPVDILHTDGRERQAPTLPDAIDLETANGTYTSSDRIVVRTPEVSSKSAVRVQGLVRGMTVEQDLSTIDRPVLATRNVTIDVVNATTDDVTLEVHLVDADTGAPINTDRTTGRLTVDGHRVQTDHTGTGTITLPRRSVYSATYDPGTWWDDDATALGDHDTVYVSGSMAGLLDTLFRAGVPLGIILFGIFLVDRITRWNVWPPWRGIR